MNKTVNEIKNNHKLSNLKNLFFDPLTQIERDFWQPFTSVLESDNPENLKKNWDKKVDVHGNTLLHIAELYRANQLACYMKNIFPSLSKIGNSTGQRPVHFEIFNDNHFLKYPAYDYLIPDNHGFTPLHIAAETIKLEILKLLNDFTTPDWQITNVYEATPLHWALKNNKNNINDRYAKAEFARSLLKMMTTKERENFLKQKNAIGMSPKMWAEETMTGREIDLIFRGIK